MMDSHLLQRVDIGLSTKHSIQVVWSVLEDSLVQVSGFQVRYQAVGSHVVQYSRVLSSSTFSHYITRLHENTIYDVCVNVFTVDEGSTTTMMTDWSSADLALVSNDSSISCVTGSTSIDAFRVALGSTLGAFIALAVVVAFVLLAKCQHRRRVRRIGRRRRRYSDKSMPLTDSDNLSFFDYYYDDDDYGSVCNDNGKNDDTPAAAATEFSLGFSPTRFLPVSRCDETRFGFTDEFIVIDDGDVAGQELNVGDTNTPFYYTTHNRGAEGDRPPAEADATQYGWMSAASHADSVFDSGVVRPAVFVSGIDDSEERHAVAQGFQVYPSSLSSPPRCFSDDAVKETFNATVGPNSEVLRLMTVKHPTATSTVDIVPGDCRDTTGLLTASGIERRTSGGLKPNHYSSLW